MKLPAISCGEFHASARREREQGEQSGFADCEPKRAYKINDWIFAVAKFEEGSVLARLIHFFKYDGIKTIHEILVSLLPTTLPAPFLSRKTLLIPVPLHPRRLRKRGFNQSMLIAQDLGERWQCAISPNFLIRHRYTHPQAELKREHRLTNVRDAFRLVSNKTLFNEDTNYLLVDDVCTTGATLTECAKALKAGGARHIYGVVIARTV